MDWTQLFICITGLAGHLLIARQDRRGYWFWIAGNVAIIKLSLADAHYGMAGLFLVYTFISLKALRDWGRKDKLSQANARTQLPGQNVQESELTSMSLRQALNMDSDCCTC